MLFLIQDVFIDVVNVRMGIGKAPKALLPRKFTFYPFLLIDEIG
jgi:hypothetical protein